MIRSLALKLGMLVVTTGIVLWIGWRPPTPIQLQGISTQGQVTEFADRSSHRRSDQNGGTPPSLRKASQHNQVLLDLNRANADELEALPGIGAVLAQRMIAFRKSIGRFRTVDDLRDVKGIGAKKFDRLKPLVTVSTREPQRETERRAL
jgi:competence protein ComEA